MLRNAAIFFLILVFSLNLFVHTSSTMERGIWWRGKVAKEIGLTDEQSGKIEDIFSSYKDRIKNLDQELRTKEAKLEDKIQDPESTREEILRLTDDVEKVKSKLRRIKVDMFYQIRNVLSPDQRDKLRKIRSRY